MWILYSSIEYEGDTFHGIFNSKEKAEKVQETLEKEGYDTQNYCITWCSVDKLMYGFDDAMGFKNA